MMGHREQLKSGDEYDAFTGWRKVRHFKPGERAATKRKFWKRMRKAARLDLSPERSPAAPSTGPAADQAAAAEA